VASWGRANIAQDWSLNEAAPQKLRPSLPQRGDLRAALSNHNVGGDPPRRTRHLWRGQRPRLFSSPGAPPLISGLRIEGALQVQTALLNGGDGTSSRRAESKATGADQRARVICGRCVNANPVLLRRNLVRDRTPSNCPQGEGVRELFVRHGQPWVGQGGPGFGADRSAKNSPNVIPAAWRG
jgi:hypothetical protein